MRLVVEMYIQSFAKVIERGQLKERARARQGEEENLPSLPTFLDIKYTSLFLAVSGIRKQL